MIIFNDNDVVARKILNGKEKREGNSEFCYYFCNFSPKVQTCTTITIFLGNC